VDIWQAAMAQNPEPFVSFLGGEGKIDLLKESWRFLTRESKITLPALATAIIEKPGKLLQKRNQEMLELAAGMQQEIEARLGDNGVLLCPVFSTPAPKHSWIWKDLLGMGYSGLINVLEFPATVIPIYHREDGLPVSIQVVAARWNDHLTLAAAAALEQTFGGWRPIERVK